MSVDAIDIVIRQALPIIAKQLATARDRDRSQDHVIVRSMIHTPRSTSNPQNGWLFRWVVRAPARRRIRPTRWISSRGCGRWADIDYRQNAAPV